MTESLCERCERMREIISGKGSRFLLCQHSQVEPQYPKYPPQPVSSCRAHVGPNGGNAKNQAPSAREKCSGPAIMKSM